MLVEPVDLVPPNELGGVHFIAIGGAGMSGVAQLMCRLGLPVSGSDQRDSAVLTQLRELGAEVYVGHDAAHLSDRVGTVVVSSAVPDTNPELRAARERGLRIWHRSAALASLMLGTTGVAVAGTHGKTTTSAMTTIALTGARWSPGYVIGAPLADTGTSAALGDGEVFVVEADESDGSFLQYPADHGVITNIEADHLDNWQTPQRYAEGYRRFATGVRTLVVNVDDPGARALADELVGGDIRVVTCGTAADAEVRLSDIHHSRGGDNGWWIRGTVHHPHATVELRLRVPGVFNLHNALAAWTIAVELGVAPAAAAEALAGFSGTSRRFEYVGRVAGITVHDDYAHHPTEVAATLTAAQDAVADGGRVVAVFQPHLFSRTRDFATEFGAALRIADLIVVTDVYPARESPIPGVSGELIVTAARDAAPDDAATVRWCPDTADVTELVVAEARPGDLILTLGAGDITTIAPRMVTGLKGRFG